MSTTALRHIHLPNITPFTKASTLQSILVRQFLSHKAVTSSPRPPPQLPPPPTPTLLTFSPTPVYTTGRRELGTLSPSQISFLTQPLEPLPAISPNFPQAEVKETLRGGQITFHGPGQLVIYPILDLKAVRSVQWPRGLSVRCYVNVLEEATIRTVAGFGIRGLRTENPGVWVAGDRKIAALGVHLRRNVASYGVGLNVETDLRWFDRIVACGLEGKRTTSVSEEGRDQWGSLREEREMDRVARRWAREFTLLLWGEEGVLNAIDEKETGEVVEGLMKEAEGDGGK